MATIDTEQTGMSDTLIAEIGDMHARAEHWKSAFEFYEVELRFLRSLMDKFAIWLDDDEQVQQFISSDNMVTTLERKSTRLAALVLKQMFNLRMQVQDPLSRNIEDCREAQYRIEMLHSEFMKEMLPLKKAVFELTEIALEKQGQGNTLYGCDT